MCSLAILGALDVGQSEPSVVEDGFHHGLKVVAHESDVEGLLSGANGHGHVTTHGAQPNRVATKVAGANREACGRDFLGTRDHYAIEAKCGFHSIRTIMTAALGQLVVVH